MKLTGWSQKNKSHFIMKSISLIQSISENKCPKCRESQLFVAPINNITKFTDMHNKCSNCGQSFIPEPGFYTGAMYVSYAIQVAVIVGVVVLTNLLNIEAGIGWYFGWVIGLVIVLIPWTYRLSRSIWIHIFVQYERKEATSIKNSNTIG